MKYFKYTNGESFTLDNIDYVGPFNITNNLAYSGKSGGVLLSPKSTFMSKLYTNAYNLDTTYKNIEQLTKVYSNTLDLLDKQGLDSIFDKISNNNLVCYKNLVLSNPTVFNYIENGGFYYGLSSITENDDVVYPKATPIHIEPYSNFDKWAFMDNINMGIVAVDTHENFKYICSDRFNTYMLSGSFTGNTPLDLRSSVENTPYYNETHQIHNDIESKRLYFVKNDFIEVYDASNYSICDSLILIDRLSLIPTSTKEYIWNLTDVKWNEFSDTWDTKFNTINLNNPQYIKFGRNIRTSIKDGILYILNKNSDDIYNQISLDTFNIGDILDIDVQPVSDNVIILNRDSESNLWVCCIDPQNVNISENIQIYSISSTLDDYKIRFTEYDSNIFHIYNNTEYQTRNISNPRYPSGRLELNDLNYFKKYIWNTTDELWKYVPIKWDSNNTPSNFYNNLTVANVVSNNKMYMILQNVGRLYILSQPLDDRFFNSVPLNLPTFFNGLSCSNSSMGLYINSYLSIILKDTLNIMNKSNGSFTLTEFNTQSKQVNDFILDIENLYINGNEVLSIITIQRILYLILDIQTKLLPLSIEN